MVPAVHVCAGKAAQRIGLLLCTGGQEANHVTRNKKWAGTYREVSVGPLLCACLTFGCWARFVGFFARPTAGWGADLIELSLSPPLF